MVIGGTKAYSGLATALFLSSHALSSTAGKSFVKSYTIIIETYNPLLLLNAFAL